MTVSFSNWRRPPIFTSARENSFVAQFIGESNRLTGTVVEETNGACTVTLDTGEQVKALPVKYRRRIEQPDDALAAVPKRVVLNPRQGECDSTVSGRVAEMIYLGDHIRTRLSVCGVDNFHCQGSERPAPLGIGAGANRFRWGWRMEDCRAPRHAGDGMSREPVVCRVDRESIAKEESMKLIRSLALVALAAAVFTGSAIAQTERVVASAASQQKAHLAPYMTQVPGIRSIHDASSPEVVARKKSVNVEQTELVVVSWGGAYTASQQKAYHDPYMEEKSRHQDYQ